MPIFHMLRRSIQNAERLSILVFTEMRIFCSVSFLSYSELIRTIRANDQPEVPKGPAVIRRDFCLNRTNQTEVRYGECTCFNDMSLLCFGDPNLTAFGKQMPYYTN